jgi:hypothetical protein
MVKIVMESVDLKTMALGLIAKKHPIIPCVIPPLSQALTVLLVVPGIDYSKIGSANPRKNFNDQTISGFQNLLQGGSHLCFDTQALIRHTGAESNPFARRVS